MTYRVASDLARTVFGQKELHPRLVCSWTLDPASHRLSCAWAPPAAGWDVAFLSPLITPTAASTGLSRAKAHSWPTKSP